MDHVHDVDGASGVFVVLEYEALDLDVVTAEKVENVGKLVFSACYGVFDACVVIVLYIVLAPARVLKPLRPYLRRNRGAVKDVLVLDDDLAYIGAVFGTEDDHGVLSARFLGSYILLDIGAGTYEDGSACGSFVGCLFDGPVRRVRGAVSAEVIAVFRNIQHSAADIRCFRPELVQ